MFKRVLEKLSKHSRWLKSDTTAARVPVGKSQDSVAADAGGAKRPRRLAGRPTGAFLPHIGSFRANEVLAINLANEALAKVRIAGYRVVGTIELPDFGLTITRLAPPESLDAIGGWGRLYDLLPEGGFALNRIYAPYRPSSGPDGSRAGPASGKSCTADRCFGATLINWQARHAACAGDVTVGIVDTDFDRNHPALAGARYEYAEFLPEGSTKASNQHGTGILSLLAGSALSGTPGLIPDARYMVANAFFADSGGEHKSDTVHLLQALHWLKRKGAAVVNLSLAGPDDELVHHGMQVLTKAGIVVVAAAGNEGPSAPPSYPAAYEEVIAVTAVDRNLAVYRYAGRGDHIDIAAPGVEVWTALPGRREGPQTGTSFAVPYVTAVVVVALRDAGLRPDDDPLASKRRALAQLHKNIRSLAPEGRDSTYGAGLVQAPAMCDPPAPMVAANSLVAVPWAATVQPALDPPAVGPLAVGSWMSTVRTASSNKAAR